MTLTARARASRANFLQAARQLFPEYGVEGVSTDMLCRQAGASKASLYKYFGGKEGLFAAMIDAEGEIFEVPTSALPESPKEMRDAVLRFGRALVGLLAQPHIQRNALLMFKQSASDPDTAKLFFERTVEATRKRLTLLIEHGVARGFIDRTQRPRDLATYLLSLWEGIDHYQVHLGLDPSPHKNPARLLDDSVRLVLGLHPERSAP